jgi:nitrate reductase delta subunit
MVIFKVLSALLSYPGPELAAATGELRDALARVPGLRRGAIAGLQELIGELENRDLYALQERYVALFDRGRRLSLHLFEHVHGESKDRGQAMVDLVDAYRSHGFDLAARELPDYLPLFLEFLAQLPERDAKGYLADAMPIVALLGERLAARQSIYAAIFDALVSIGGRPADAAQIRRRVAAEGPDQTVVQMDRIWEEEAVSFLGNQATGCAARPGTEQPLRPMQRPSQ